MPRFAICTKPRSRPLIASGTGIRLLWGIFCVSADITACYYISKLRNRKQNVGGGGGLMTLTKCNTMYTTYYEGGTIYADDRNRNIQDDTGA